MSREKLRDALEAWIGLMCLVLILWTLLLLF